MAAGRGLSTAVTTLAATVSMPSMSGLGIASYRYGFRVPAVLMRFLCPRCRAGLCDQRLRRRCLHGAQVSMPSMSGWALRQQWVGGHTYQNLGFLCPRCRAGLCDVPGMSQQIVTALFLCPRCRAGLCDGCLPRGAVTWAFGVRCAILAGTARPGKGFQACSAKPAADQGVSARQPRSLGAVRQETVPAHVMIQGVLAFIDHPRSQERSGFRIDRASALACRPCPTWVGHATAGRLVREQGQHPVLVGAETPAWHAGSSGTRGARVCRGQASCTRCGDHSDVWRRAPSVVSGRGWRRQVPSHGPMTALRRRITPGDHRSCQSAASFGTRRSAR